MLPDGSPADWWLVAGLLAHAGLVTMLLIPMRDWPLATGLALAEALPVLWRRITPAGALAVHLLVKPLTYLADIPVGELAWLVLMHAVGRYLRWRVGLMLLVAACALVPVLLLAISPAAARSPGMPIGVLQLAISWGLGCAGRAAARNRLLMRRRHERERLRVLIDAQRGRIGSELHEVVTRRLRAIAATAGCLGERSTVPVADLRALREECRDTLTVLRRMLGLLRTTESETSAGPKTSTESETSAGPKTSAGPETGADEARRSGSRPRWHRLLPAPADAVLVVALFLGAVAVHAWSSGFAVTGGSEAISLLYLPSTLSLPGTTTTLALLLLVYSAGAWGRSLHSALCIPVALVIWAFGAKGAADAPAPAPNTEMYTALLFCGLYVAGRVRGRFRMLTDSAARYAEDRRIRERLRQERNRVARQLHDHVSHHVSAMVVQAGAVRLLARQRPELIGETLRDIRESAHAALAALPRLLRALDPSGARPEGVSERLREGELGELVAPLRQAGAEVSVRLCGDPGNASREQAALAARLIRESVRNVLRHAGPSATRVLVECQPNHTVVEIVDSGPERGFVGDRGCGHGIVGMNERVALVGGRLNVGPYGSGWRVHALLPRWQAPEADLSV
ncbi:histidine kinase [Saccharopolyspora hattusasensis]|uniref:ATP-binding protein n=1 Tax=Saccharopolyspora hattusasensis TaxID=1128679 RepID=UPI003D98902A